MNSSIIMIISKICRQKNRMLPLGNNGAASGRVSSAAAKREPNSSLLTSVAVAILLRYAVRASCESAIF